MNILAIDTSSLNATVALMNDEKVIGEYTISNKKTHSQVIMPMICELLEKCSLCMDDIDVFATGIGPGSFTGLRIGIATAKALCQAKQKKIIGISSLASLAKNVSDTEKTICPIIDARRGDVYNALYKNGVCIKEDRAISLDELFEELKGKDVLFLGDGAIVYKDKIIEKMGDNAYFADIHNMLSKASSIAALAYKRAEQKDFDDYHTILPIYLRSCQAEREYNERVKEIKEN
ncbi:MAG: tRNA (adenosine(37)-N6)-threonylcarbamoyltransferase complex dimerization subunit type 1 TsaB [Ruminococcaceae bacterium]|nr:tRNA (adenosine(37)-N6)-threonylcarbamoyltransferase complex dimerization subunit type 1 TsaB [Oscillospiraceae bacterium]